MCDLLLKRNLYFGCKCYTIKSLVSANQLALLQVSFAAVSECYLVIFTAQMSTCQSPIPSFLDGLAGDSSPCPTLRGLLQAEGPLQADPAAVVDVPLHRSSTATEQNNDVTENCLWQNSKLQLLAAVESENACRTSDILERLRDNMISPHNNQIICEGKIVGGGASAKWPRFKKDVSEW